MSRKAPYPSSYEIEDIFSWRESPETMDKFSARVAPNVETTIVGDDHHFAGTHKGIDALTKHNRDRALDIIDVSKGIKLDIVRVIGGGESPWATVEMKTQAKAKSEGKKWNHEFVYIVRFDLDGKITKIRAYYDTAHINDHVETHKAHVQNGS
ncbi:MAG: hypothetical protein Q9191_005132 [Dirinaria sp. TL-2023a]